MPRKYVLLGLVGLWLAGCAQMPLTEVAAQPPKVIYQTRTVQTQTGKASYYYGRWIGRKTANGEIYRAHDMTAAHRTLPFNTKVRVTNLKNNRTVIVRINNRGPFVKGRIIDMSLAAARELQMTKAGVVPVKVEVLKEVPILTKPNLRRKSGTVRSVGNAESTD